MNMAVCQRKFVHIRSPLIVDFNIALCNIAIICLINLEQSATIYAEQKGGLTMRAVITVIGKDMVGILAGVSTICAENNANVTEVTQSIMQDLFAMIMLVDISNLSVDLAELRTKLTAYGEEKGLSVHVMHEDIFNSMHRI